jgi:hypothetical protein
MRSIKVISFAICLGLTGSAFGAEPVEGGNMPKAAFTPEAVIPVTDANVLRGLSPYNWVVNGHYIGSTVNGASVTVGFKGTRRVTLRVDMKHMKAMGTTEFPVIAWLVNGGNAQTLQLTPDETAVSLVSDLADPVIDLYVKGFSPNGDRFNGDVPPNSIKITGFTVDEGGYTAPVKLPDKVWLNIGDSIMSGDGAAYGGKQGRPPKDKWAVSDDGRASYGFLLARHFGYREGRIAYGGYRWGGANQPGLKVLLDKKTSTVTRLTGETLDPIPDFVLINLGENPVPADDIIIDEMRKVRSRVNKTTKIVVMIPVSGRARAEVIRSFNAYKASAQDACIHLLDLGQIKYETCDGQHPTAAGHKSIYEVALPAFDAILGTK